MVKECYLWAGDSKQLLAGDVQANGSAHSYWYLTDQQNSIRTIMDFDGSNQMSIDYDAFGNLLPSASGYNTWQTSSGG